MMWMDFECETSLVAKMPETSQHFFVFSVNPGVYPIKNSMASFFLFFLRNGDTNFTNLHESDANGEGEALRRFRERALARRSSPSCDS